MKATSPPLAASLLAALAATDASRLLSHARFQGPHPAPRKPPWGRGSTPSVPTVQPTAQLLVRPPFEPFNGVLPDEKRQDASGQPGGGTTLRLLLWPDAQRPQQRATPGRDIGQGRSAPVTPRTGTARAALPVMVRAMAWGPVKDLGDMGLAQAMAPGWAGLRQVLVAMGPAPVGRAGFGFGPGPGNYGGPPINLGQGKNGFPGLPMPGYGMEQGPMQGYPRGMPLAGSGLGQLPMSGFPAQGNYPGMPTPGFGMSVPAPGFGQGLPTPGYAPGAVPVPAPGHAPAPVPTPAPGYTMRPMVLRSPG